jgi:hypothetical protein
MELSQTSRSRVQALIYPVQFEADPSHGIERVVRQVIQNSVLGATAEDFIASIGEALKSETQLCSLIPQEHSEAVIRKFLAELLTRLATMHP